MMRRRGSAGANVRLQRQKRGGGNKRPGRASLHSGTPWDEAFRHVSSEFEHFVSMPDCHSWDLRTPRASIVRYTASSGNLGWQALEFCALFRIGSGHRCLDEQDKIQALRYLPPAVTGMSLTELRNFSSPLVTTSYPEHVI